jgi:hypothetical protein
VRAVQGRLPELDEAFEPTPVERLRKAGHTVWAFEPEDGSASDAAVVVGDRDRLAVRAGSSPLERSGRLGDIDPDHRAGSAQARATTSSLWINLKRQLGRERSCLRPQKARPPHEGGGRACRGGTGG